MLKTIITNKILLLIFVQFQLIIQVYSQEGVNISFTIYGKITCDSLKIPVDNANIKLWTDDGCNSYYHTDKLGNYKIDTVLSKNIDRIYLEIKHENQITKKIKIDTLNFKKSIYKELNIGVSPRLVCNDCLPIIKFHFNTARLQDGQAIVLNEFSNILRENENLIIKVIGFKDPTETTQYNLAMKRAQEVMEYLVGYRRIDKSRVMIASNTENKRPYNERKCGCVPYYILNEPIINIDETFISNINEDNVKRQYLELMRVVIVEIVKK